MESGVCHTAHEAIKENFRNTTPKHQTNFSETNW